LGDVVGGVWTYAYAWTVGAQDTDLEAIDNGVEVLRLSLKRRLGVELLGNRRVGLVVDLLGLQLLRHIDSRAGSERSDWESRESWLGASLDSRNARSERCESTSGGEHR
jgi:hypothetical protein